MADECLRRRGRRTGAAAVAAVYSGDQRQPTPPFPSVCRLVEKYTMLIERHRQNQQNGLIAPVRAGKTPTPASSSDRSSSSPPMPPQQPKSAIPSTPAIGDDDAAAWNRLLMDNGGDENENGNGDDVNGDDGYGYEDDDDDGGSCDRRFSCVSLGSIQAGTCTRDCCNRRRRLAVTAAAAAAMAVGRGGDKLPVTTCSRLSACARALVLRNDGPCVSDDERFLFFHFPFHRCLSGIASLTMFFRSVTIPVLQHMVGRKLRGIGRRPRYFPWFIFPCSPLSAIWTSRCRHWRTIAIYRQHCSRSSIEYDIIHYDYI